MNNKRQDDPAGQGKTGTRIDNPGENERTEAASQTGFNERGARRVHSKEGTPGKKNRQDERDNIRDAEIL